MITDEFGNKGYYINKINGKKCSASDIKNPGQCYFDVKIRGHANIPGYAVKTHTLQQERGLDKGMPTIQQPMWRNPALKHDCATNELSKCSDNASCNINEKYKIDTDPTKQGNYDGSKPISGVKQRLKESKIMIGGDDYWDGIWDDDSAIRASAKAGYSAGSKFVPGGGGAASTIGEVMVGTARAGWGAAASPWSGREGVSVCDWDGITCHEIPHDESKKYITVDIDDKYFNKSYFFGKDKVCSNKDSETLTQDKWVSNQKVRCTTNYLSDDLCNNNQYCEWKDSKKVCLKPTNDDDKYPNKQFNIFEGVTKEDGCGECYTGKGVKTPHIKTATECNNNNFKWTEYEWDIPKQSFAYTNPDEKLNKDGVCSSYNSDGTITEDKCESDGSTWVNKNELNKGTCSLKDSENITSGLREDNVFKNKTLNDILGEVNNGRVHDIKVIDNVKTTMKGDVVMKNDNQSTSVKGIVEETAVSSLFFSEGNIKNIQHTIRYRVYQDIGPPAIDYQSSQALYIVMRSILLQHANFNVLSKGVVNEIQKLNKYVVTYCVEEVTSNVKQYHQFLTSLENLPVPIDRPGYSEREWSKPYDLSSRNKDMHVK